MTRRTGDTVRVMSWNIHGGVGADRRFDMARVAALIDRHDPDIVALQEIDTRGRDVACLQPLRDLHPDDAHWTNARTLVAPDGHYGHTLISRWPFDSAQLHDLSFSHREPRCAIEATVATPLGPLRVIAVHLGLDILERRAQARTLAAVAAPRGTTTVAMGDFNDWFPRGAVRRTMRAVLPERSRLATFPACRPMLRLDRIYSGPDKLVASWTDRAARHSSDHLPVIADIRLAAAG